MTLVSDAADLLIGDFGEQITVYPQNEPQPEDSSDPMYFDSGTEGSSFTMKARVYSVPSEEILKKYGFDDDTEMVIYERDNSISEGDELSYNGNRFLVRRTVTNQVGEGPYVWIHDLVGV